MPRPAKIAKLEKGETSSAAADAPEAELEGSDEEDADDLSYKPDDDGEEDEDDSGEESGEESDGEQAAVAVAGVDPRSCFGELVSDV